MKQLRFYLKILKITFLVNIITPTNYTSLELKCSNRYILNWLSANTHNFLETHALEYSSVQLPPPMNVGVRYAGVVLHQTS